jgi:hypothetical protein
MIDAADYMRASGSREHGEAAGTRRRAFDGERGVTHIRVRNPL